jgi:hypothetical protein
MVVEAVTTCAAIVDFASLLGKSAPLPLAGSEASEARSRGWGWGFHRHGPKARTRPSRRASCHDDYCPCSTRTFSQPLLIRERFCLRQASTAWSPSFITLRQ